MPFRYEIRPDLRLVIATPHGVMTDPEIFSYQREVWSRPDVVGYNELVDMSEVTRIAFVSADRVAELAQLASSMDVPNQPSKMAIIASADLHFGLGRMFQAHRQMSGEGTRQVQVFRNRADALKWLGVSLPSDRV